MNEKLMSVAGALIGTAMAHGGVIHMRQDEVSDDGDLTFWVKVTESGIRTGELRECLRDRAVFGYVTSELGNWYVRRHFALFAPLIEDPRYTDRAQAFEHSKFGCKFLYLDGSPTLTFTFHLSLIARIKEEVEKHAGDKVAAAGRKKDPASPARGAVGSSRKGGTTFEQWLSGIPSLRPDEMFHLLEKHGYIGQDEARKAVCLMAYRHLSRLRCIHIDKVDRSTLPSKDNLLMMGPTGCGKTHLVELLFGRILQIPNVIVDLTSFTEAGYVGDDIPTILTRLVNAAGGDVLRASVGVVCLDEFDKVAGLLPGRGGGKVKDVSGYGVQRELLKMLESSDVCIPSELSRAVGVKRVTFGTGDLPFIACGAFSGFKMRSQMGRSNTAIGFRPDPANGKADPSAIDESDVASVESFVSYGFMPELLGRFSRVVTLQPISEDQLMAILRQNVVAKYERELAMQGIALDVGPEVCERVVKECMLRGTGVRGLSALLYQRLEGACYEAYSSREKVSRVRLALDGDDVRCLVAG